MLCIRIYGCKRKTVLVSFKDEPSLVDLTAARDGKKNDKILQAMLHAMLVVNLAQHALTALAAANAETSKQRPSPSNDANGARSKKSRLSAAIKTQSGVSQYINFRKDAARTKCEEESKRSVAFQELVTNACHVRGLRLANQRSSCSSHADPFLQKIAIRLEYSMGAQCY